MRLARTARQLPQIATDLLRQAQLSDGRPAFSVHHHGLSSTQEALARTGNRLALALVTLGLYVSRLEEQTSELQSLMRSSSAVTRLKTKTAMMIGRSLAK